MTLAFPSRTPVFNVQKTPRRFGDGARLVGRDPICNQRRFFAPILLLLRDRPAHNRGRTRARLRTGSGNIRESPIRRAHQATQSLPDFTGMIRNPADLSPKALGARPSPDRDSCHHGEWSKNPSDSCGGVQRLLVRPSTRRKVRLLRQPKEAPQIPATNAYELMASSVQPVAPCCPAPQR